MTVENELKHATQQYNINFIKEDVLKKIPKCKVPGFLDYMGLRSFT